MAFIRSFLIVFALVAVCSGLARADEPLLCRARGSADADRVRLRRRYLGGRPRRRHGARLITGVGLASAPYFSPDGSMIAFSANYDGNADVYVVSPAAENRDGSHFSLRRHRHRMDARRLARRFPFARASCTDAAQLYTISAIGGMATMLPLPDAQGGSSRRTERTSRTCRTPSGSRIGRAIAAAKRRRSGSPTSPIPRWTASLPGPLTTATRCGSATDLLRSDRDGPVTLFAYDLRTATSTRLVENLAGFDIVRPRPAREPSFTRSSTRCTSSTWRRGRTAGSDVDRRRDGAGAAALAPEGGRNPQCGISPTGVRALFEAHGDIFTAADAVRRRSQPHRVPGAAERDPAWSPNGRWMAYFSDASGEYRLRLKDQKGLRPAASDLARALSVVLLYADVVAGQQEDRLQR